MNIFPQILGFQGEYRFLSNFYRSEFWYAGHLWPAVEHCYVTHKIGDPNTIPNFHHIAREVVNMTAGEVKRFGRTLELRKDWDEVKPSLMLDFVSQKFFQNPFLAEKLLKTEDAYLEETNNWNDTYWGVCNGKGMNILGIILMRVRTGIKEYYRNVGVPLCLNS